MTKTTRLRIFHDSPARRSSGSIPQRSRRPVVERLEERQLMAATAISSLQQYGTPSTFAIDQFGIVFYNVLTIQNGLPVFTGWTPVNGAFGARAISAGTVAVNGFLRPNMFLLNTAQNIYYTSQNNSGDFNSLTPVGVDVGATAIASGLIPLANAPYVVLINGARDVYYNFQTAGGSWAGWSPVGVAVGATQIATGVVQVSLSPTVFEPYVFMTNGNNDVYFKIRNINGSWGAWSPVGVGVGAASISAVTINNKPYVTMLNGAGGLYVNFGLSNRTWAGWSPVGSGSANGAVPAVAMASVVSSYNIYAMSVNLAGQVNSTYGTYGKWSKWFGLGVLGSSVNTTAISVTSDPKFAPFAFVIGTDGNVYWNFQFAWAQWSQWTNLGAPF